MRGDAWRVWKIALGIFYDTRLRMYSYLGFFVGTRLSLVLGVSWTCAPRLVEGLGFVDICDKRPR